MAMLKLCTFGSVSMVICGTETAQSRSQLWLTLKMETRANVQRLRVPAYLESTYPWRGIGQMRIVSRRRPPLDCCEDLSVQSWKRREFSY